jgi:hypothetical protein
MSNPSDSGRVSSLHDPQIAKLRRNISELFAHLVDFEWRAKLALWFLLAICSSNFFLLVYKPLLRKSVLFVVFSNFSVFVTVAYYRDHGHSKVTQRYVGLMNNALATCFLQLRQIGSSVELSIAENS